MYSQILPRAASVKTADCINVLVYVCIVSWVRIPPRLLFSLKKEKSVLGVYILPCLLVMYMTTSVIPVSPLEGLTALGVLLTFLILLRTCIYMYTCMLITILVYTSVIPASLSVGAPVMYCIALSTLTICFSVSVKEDTTHSRPVTDRA